MAFLTKRAPKVLCGRGVGMKLCRVGKRLPFGISLLSWMNTLYPEHRNKSIILKAINEFMFIVFTFVLYAHFS